MRGLCALPAVLGLALATSGCFPPSGTEIQFPTDLKEVRIIVGEHRFQKSIVFEGADLGKVTDIRYEGHPPGSPAQLVVVGTRGAAYLDPNLRQTGLVRFETYIPKYVPEHVALVRMRDGSAPSFLAREKMHVVLFDQSGKPVWIYTGYFGINDAAAGDVNGDGVAEVVIGLNGFAGLRLLNADGRKLWGKYRDGNIWQVAIVPASGSRSGRILHTEAGGELRVRDQFGVQLGSYRPDGEYIADFSPTRWWDGSEETRFVSVDEGRLFVFNSDGERITRLPASGCHHLGDAVGIPVHFAGSGPYYATVIEYDFFDRSVVSMHDVGGQFVFQEIVKESCNAVQTIPAPGGERLLVGCGGSVWEYSLTPVEKKKASRK